MSYTDIDKPTDYFNTVAYSGTGVNPTSITSLDFKPDFLWIKSRSDAFSHLLFDAVRGVDKRLISNSTGAETTEVQISSFDTNGWTMDSDTANNGSGKTYVGWSWLGSNTTASNTSGSITSTVSANTTSGFSIVSYTGTGSASTIGHSLGVAPKVVLVKNRDGVDVWVMQHGSLADNEFLEFNGTAGKQTDSARFNGTAPTSTVFSVGTSGTTNGNTEKFIAYCFAEKKGFSKFGSYTGNGSTDGTFVYTGFKPAFVLTKNTTDGHGWWLLDNKRDLDNPVTQRLQANNSNAESSTEGTHDFLSNGFKLRRGDYGDLNESGAEHIYMAFAENPFVTSTGIPTTAR